MNRESIAAAFNRSRMATAIGRRTEKERAAALAALRLAATDIAATCQFDHGEFMRECGF